MKSSVKRGFIFALTLLIIFTNSIIAFASDTDRQTDEPTNQYTAKQTEYPTNQRTAKQADRHPENDGKRILFISSYSYSWESVPRQITGLEVESEVNMGTTFHIHMDLTLATSKDVFLEQKNVKLEKLNGCHILVAEDHPLNQEIIKRILEKAEAKVTVKGDGQEAVKEFKAHPDYYDAILMDIRMPVMDGITAATEIRNLKFLQAKKIPIIALTANSLAKDKEETKRAGMNAHLLKPIDTKKLYETLEKCMGA